MKEFWDERYAKKNYVYGTLPNAFFKYELSKLKAGKILLPAEGEGRNAVYAAEQDWEVFAFDYSIEAQHKAFTLADKKQVSIHYEVVSFDEINYEPDLFDCIAMFFVHMSSSERQKNHQKVIRWLKPGGTFLLEAFSKNQINKSSGGPKNIEMLFTKEELKADFTKLTKLEIDEMNTFLDEGNFHKGEATVVRMKGIK